MAEMREGGALIGSKYVLLFARGDGKTVVHVLRVTQADPAWPRGTKVSSPPYLDTDTRELPLPREEAAELVDRYLYDLSPEDQERAIEQLCRPE